jgi:hypothetical protein
VITLYLRFFLFLLFFAGIFRVRVFLIILILGFIKIYILSLLLLSLFHPIHNLIHSLLSFFIILIDLKLDIIMLTSKLSSNNLLDLFSIFYFNIFKVLSKCFKLILFIQINSIVNELCQVSVQIHRDFLHP